MTIYRRHHIQKLVQMVAKVGRRQSAWRLANWGEAHLLWRDDAEEGARAACSASADSLAATRVRSSA